MPPQKITEKDRLHENWYEEAKKQTLETLPAFLERLTKDYDHDYGTICHAVSAAGIGAMWAVDKSPQGGITGFQAGCILWSVIDKWGSFSAGPKKMVVYEEMLYPQYEDKFSKVISKDTFEWLKKEAEKNLKDHPVPDGALCDRPDVVEHWKSIVNGKVPFGYVVNE